jgi:hypothetical protein
MAAFCRGSSLFKHRPGVHRISLLHGMWKSGMAQLVTEHACWLKLYGRKYGINIQEIPVYRRGTCFDKGERIMDIKNEKGIYGKSSGC